MPNETLDEMNRPSKALSVVDHPSEANPVNDWANSSPRQQDKYLQGFPLPLGEGGGVKSETPDF